MARSPFTRSCCWTLPVFFRSVRGLYPAPSSDFFPGAAHRSQPCPQCKQQVGAPGGVREGQQGGPGQRRRRGTGCEERALAADAAAASWGPQPTAALQARGFAEPRLRASSASEPWFASALRPAGPRPGCSGKAESGLREGGPDPHGPARARAKPPSQDGSHKSSTDPRKWHLRLNSAVVIRFPPTKEDAWLSPDSVQVPFKFTLVSTAINNGDGSRREIPSVNRSNVH